MDELEVVARFGAAWAAHDLDATMALVTDDVVFESTSPGPDGERFEGRAAVREVWRAIFEDSSSQFDVEETHALQGLVVQLWRYSWSSGHVRGIDLFTLRGDLVEQKRSYVKG